VGALKELQACNNYSDTPHCAPATEDPQDCVLDAWTSWTACTKDCGGGQQRRTRDILKESKHGGIPCGDTLEETQGCKLDSCETQREVTNCEWNEWSNFGACDKCGGQKKRSRNIKAMPLHGGTPCTFDASEETQACDRLCHTALYCEWGDWTSGNCSTSCGSGFSKRTRVLEHTDRNPQRLFEVSDATPATGQYSLQDVFVSFAVGGFVTFMVVFLGMRVMRSARKFQYDAVLE